MGTNNVHEYYQKVCNELVSDKFKKDFIDVAVQVYGEEYRDMFEKNMSNIVLHPKVCFKNKTELNKKESITDIEKEALDKLEKVNKEEIKNQKIKNQKELLTVLKKRLNEEEAEKLQEIIDKEDFEGEFRGKKVEEKLSDLDKMLKQMMGEEVVEVDKTVLYDLIEKYHLDNPQKSFELEDEIPELKEYWKKQSEAEIKGFSNNYEELKKELNSDEKEGLDLYKEYTYMSGSFVTGEEENGEYKHHIFMEINERFEQSRFMHTITHEILHLIQCREVEIDGKTERKIGHKDVKEKSDRYTLLSEMLHELTVMKEIVPRLNEKGYDIDNEHVDDYIKRVKKEGVYKFFKTYKEQILRTACQEDIKELTDIVGKENWDKLADDVRENSGREQEQIVQDMQDYSKASLAIRIGKDTKEEQYDIQGKKKAEKELEEIMELHKMKGKEQGVELDD